MDKNAIKKYAVWARNELIARVSQKAQQYGITAEGYGDKNADSINGVLLSATEKKQRQALIAKIDAEGFEQVMEEVAYTWFNRFTALRFMEVNKYLPSHTRVFTNEANEFKPQILADAISLELEGLDMDKVFELKNANKDEELYKYLLIVQCNALSSILPGVFQKIADYTELLLPDYLLREGSVIEQMITLIPEKDWTEQVQIIGWLYQFYNVEPKAEVFSKPKGAIITKEEIPAATELFTPDWIVRYMVENSLGRIWIEGHPNEKLKSEWRYYLDETEQEPNVQNQIEKICKDYATITPEQIKCIDPCSGSGHILAYMFDVLIQIYEANGYNTRDAVKSIVENNIYGLDIDERAAQLANFLIMMKGRQYDSRFFKRGVHPHVFPILESNHVDKFALEYFCNGDSKLDKAMNTIIKELHDAREYGSILTITPQDWGYIYDRFSAIRDDISMQKDLALMMLPMVQVAEVLSRKYDIVVTNPPYMAVSAGSAKLNDYVKKNYPDSKTDMFAVFIERCGKLTKPFGMQAMITMHAWMFISSYENLRKKILTKDIINMAHLGARAFEEIGGEVVQTTSFVLRNSSIKNYVAKYSRLVDALSEKAKEEAYLTFDSLLLAKKENFHRIEGSPIAYWVSESVYSAYQNYPSLGSLAAPRKGNSTSDNNRFLRLWHEVNLSDINFGCKELRREDTLVKRWYPYNKGGGYRKWYGFNDYIVDWYDDAAAIRAIKTAVIANYQYFMKPGLTWSTLASNDFSIRWFDEGFIFDNGGCCIFDLGDKRAYICALLNSSVFKYIFGQLNPTLNFQSGEVAKFPVIYSDIDKVSEISFNCVVLSKEEYDSFETSWDFKRHPLVSRSVTCISEAYAIWEQECESRFEQVRFNEEELNRFFINIYGLQDELMPNVEDKDITIRKADLQRDIRSLISYAVGCMFGRYSLEVDGITYAGGQWNAFNHNDFVADSDNIIPICDDEYFGDDIVGRFVEFIRLVYGSNALEENLRFIADALGGKGQPREVIRNYFINYFFKDHCKIYQKRPIYWLFDSGKKNGFKCLIYMHRYKADTIARIRTDYVHEQQSRYRTVISDLEQRINSASTGERVKLGKQLKNIQEQADELRLYEEKIHHLADQMISIDLDDGVKVNYAKFQDVLAKIK